MVDEKIELNKIHMSPSENPKCLFDKIKSVETRFNTKMYKTKEEEKIAVVLSQAPLQCKSTLTNEQRIKKSLGFDVTMKDLREAMNQHFRLLNEHSDEKE